MVRLVLLRPRNPENLGAIARAMKNLGLEDWAIAALGTHDFEAARRVAVHAEDLLDRPRIVRTLDEAVADCAWVVGTCSRRVRGRRSLSPQEVAQEALRAALRASGFLAGPERHAIRDLVATLRRSRLTGREARLWLAALRTRARAS